MNLFFQVDNTKVLCADNLQNMWIHVRTITYFCFIEKLSESSQQIGNIWDCSPGNFLDPEFKEITVTSVLSHLPKEEQPI